MRNKRSQGFVAMVLSALLVSCGAAPRYMAPIGAEELVRLVLVMEETPDGRVSQSWRRAEDFDLERYKSRSLAEGNVGRIILAASQQTDCYAQYLECYQQCRQTPIPPDFNQYIHDFGPRAGHDRYCSEKCMPQYSECLKAQGSRVQSFKTTEGVVDWLKRNHESVLMGRLVVIAGVLFSTVSGGAGAVILVPVVLLTSSEGPCAAHIVAVSP